MSQSNSSGIKTFTAGGTIGKYLRVSLSAAGTVIAATAGAPWIGTSLDNYDATTFTQASVLLSNAPGTRKMVASGAITVNAPVYGDTGGKITATQALKGTLIGYALEAATADGDIIEVMVVSPGLRTCYGQSTTVAASDTIVTGLSTVIGVVATLNDAPVAGCQFVTADVGDQAGAPAAGSFLLKTWKSTAAGDTTQIAATTFTKKVNWIAFGT